MIWFGWMSYCCASSADVRSPFIAANSTCALNAGEWFRRFLLAMLLLSFETAYAVGRESKAMTYPSVQVLQASSVIRLSTPS